MSLGYGNFSTVVQYDIYAMADKYLNDGHPWGKDAFNSDNDYRLDLSLFESVSILNSPNLSIFPLLAYHKICNDHYRNEKWQPFEPWTCNIDYVTPTSNMNARSFINIDLENSNLPIDYFTSVLPRAQYGDESAVPIGLNNADATLIVKDSADPSKGVLFGTSAYTSSDFLEKANFSPTPSHGSYAPCVS